MIGLIRLLAALLLLISLSGCDRAPNTLDRIREAGVVRVGTVLLSGSFWQDAGGASGLEHGLVSAFARFLGVKVKWQVYPDRSGLLDAIASGAVDLGAASLVVDDAAKSKVRFGRVYATDPLVAAYRRETSRPRTVKDLNPADLTRVAQAKWSELTADITPSSPLKALVAVENGEAGAALVFGHQLKGYQFAFPQLREAFSLGPRGDLAWAFPRRGDDSFYTAALRWLGNARENGTVSMS